VLHTVCALSVGGNASYDLLIPAERGLDLAALIDHCARAGFDGVNVTYPYKEDAASLVPPGDPAVAAIGSANTLRFTPEGPRAYNTDFTGFVGAWQQRFGETSPGPTLVIGTGGVGRAVAFGLARLGAPVITLVDSDPAKASALAAALSAHSPGTRAIVADGGNMPALDSFRGVVNCTPLGMAGRPGSPLPEGTTGHPAWSFDAVYTPEFTRFRAQTERMGAEFLSGYELYFRQGVQAFEIFTGARPDIDWVRGVLAHRA
jgi:shikimate dehydrogenase